MAHIVRSGQTGQTSAVVTGAGRGIGRAVAEQLVRRGHAVVVTDVDGEAARRTAAEIGAVEGLAQDVRDEVSHLRVAAAALAHAPLGVWVNNAGVGDDGPLAELSSDSLRRLVEVNLLGVAYGVRAALDAFADGEGLGGDIVTIASLSGLGPVPGLSMYAATKAAVVSLTTSVAAETPRNMRLHAICPDGVDTEMVAAMRPDGLAKALVHSGGGLLSVDDVARAAVASIGSRRVVVALPAWRGGLMRLSAVAPLLMRGLPLFRALGQRAMRASRD